MPKSSKSFGRRVSTPSKRILAMPRAVAACVFVAESSTKMTSLLSRPTVARTDANASGDGAGQVGIETRIVLVILLHSAMSIKRRSLLD